MLPVTNNFFRTFFIKGKEYGTAFTLDVDGAEYFVTARHLMNVSDANPTIKLFRHKQWHDISATVVGHGKNEVDVSVLRLPVRLTHESIPVTPSLAGAAIGQDMYFQGFPYKMWGDVGDFMGGYPCAFTKKGVLSFIQHGDPQVIYLDAINNEGYSGAPIIFSPPSDPMKPCIAGVVSKFRVEREPVLTEFGEPTGMIVEYNTGFLIAYGITHVLEIIGNAQGRVGR